jgi:hypothetical protein
VPTLATRTSSECTPDSDSPHPEPGGNVRKKLLVKIFAGPIWEGRLVEFIGVFTKRREEFQFALAIHTTVGVYAANLKLDTVNERTAELSQRYDAPLYIFDLNTFKTSIRMDVMLQLFQEFVTPEQKKLAAMVGEMGGDAALENEETMKELAGAETALTTHSGLENEQAMEELAGTEIRYGRSRPFNFVKLRREIKGNPGEAIERNAEFFNHKFNIQRRQIVEDITRAVNREGDRIITAVTAGPHNQIVDQV